MRDLHKLGSVTIPDTAAVSDAIQIPAGYAIVAVDVDASWTAADLGFQISTDGGTTYVDVWSGVGTTTSRSRLTGIPTTAAFVVVPQVTLGFCTPGTFVKITSINAASNADAAQTGAVSARIWVARSE